MYCKAWVNMSTLTRQVYCKCVSMNPLCICRESETKCEFMGLVNLSVHLCCYCINQAWWLELSLAALSHTGEELLQSTVADTEFVVFVSALKYSMVIVNFSFSAKEHFYFLNESTCFFLISLCCFKIAVIISVSENSHSSSEEEAVSLIGYKKHSPCPWRLSVK